MKENMRMQLRYVLKSIFKNTTLLIVFLYGKHVLANNSLSEGVSFSNMLGLYSDNKASEDAYAAYSLKYNFDSNYTLSTDFDIYDTKESPKFGLGVVLGYRLVFDDFILEPRFGYMSYDDKIFDKYTVQVSYQIFDQLSVVSQSSYLNSTIPNYLFGIGLEYRLFSQDVADTSIKEESPERVEKVIYDNRSADVGDVGNIDAVENETKGEVCSLTHRVIDGDTLWKISSNYHEELSHLMTLNKFQLTDPDKIYPGMVIILDRSPCDAFDK